jgi:hypothetical protein
MRPAGSAVANNTDNGLERALAEERAEVLETLNAASRPPQVRLYDRKRASAPSRPFRLSRSPSLESNPDEIFSEIDTDAEHSAPHSLESSASSAKNAFLSSSDAPPFHFASVDSDRNTFQKSDSHQDSIDDREVRTAWMKSKLEDHRKALRQEFESLKNKQGVSLYTEVQIDRQLQPPGSTQNEPDDYAFGKTGSITYFMKSAKPVKPGKSRQPAKSLDQREVLSFEALVFKMTINDTAFTESENEVRGLDWDKDFQWVHLPANNFELVYVCISS